MWTLPSFDPAHRACLERLFADRRAELESHPFWIVDVRGNDGGADHTYAPLLDWLMANDWVSVGVEFLAIPANLAAHPRVCEVLGPTDAKSRDLTSMLVAALRAVPSGSYARLDEERDGFVRRQPVPFAWQRPGRVVVLIDRNCASAAEQFVLDVRQSRRVKLLGQPTCGALDHSNLRPHPLPSGKHMLWYATPRSLRLPHFPIDGIGVAPDLFLPPAAHTARPEAEIHEARRFLESGG